MTESEEPLFIIGTPMCTAFRPWQRIDALWRDLEWYLASTPGRWSVSPSACRHGRCFRHEHPARAASWGGAVVVRMLKSANVSRIVTDQPQCVSESKHGSAIRKPTGFMNKYEAYWEGVAATMRGMALELYPRMLKQTSSRARTFVLWRAPIVLTT